MTVEAFEAPTGALRVRETHDYVGTFAHLDRWSDVGGYVMLSGRPLPTGDDADGSLLPGLAVTLLVEAEGDVDDATLERAIVDSFTSRGCAHEWDCCGCTSTSVDSARRVRGDVWAFDIGRSSNV